MKILLGSKNPGKIEGTKLAFENYFKELSIEGVPVLSNVSEEPVNEEIYIGAKNRVDNLVEYAKEENIDCDYFVGVESGIAKIFGNWMIINVAVLRDKAGFLSVGTSSGFPVPDKYVEEIIKTDLGKVMDRIFDKSDLRSSKGGISYLTKGKITRINLTTEAIVMALTQFINESIWK